MTFRIVGIILVSFPFWNEVEDYTYIPAPPPLCGTVFAEVTSANIVGYTTKAAVEDSVQVGHPTVGSMFASINSANSFKLADIKMSTKEEGGEKRVDGGGYRTCFLQVIDPTSSKIDYDKIYTYYSYADGCPEDTPEAVGWYTYNDIDEEKDDQWASDLDFPAGQAFLCDFVVSKEVNLTFAGAVIKGDITIDSVVNGIAFAHPYIVNPIPTSITLADIEMKTVDGDETVDGGGYRTCFLQVINPTSSKIDYDKIYTYYSYVDGCPEDTPEAIGWYTYNDIDEEKDDQWASDVAVAAGDGFLCDFVTAMKVKLVFKNPVK